MSRQDDIDYDQQADQIRAENAVLLEGFETWLVSLLSAMLGSLAEAGEVLAERGARIDIKVLRRITYRFSERARLTQRLQGLGFDETVARRRVVVSMDGGRIRLKEKKRGRKTPNGRSRYKGAWREPKLFIIYVVDAEGKMERSFMPIMDANLRGPDTLFKLLRNYLGQVDHRG